MNEMTGRSAEQKAKGISEAVEHDVSQSQGSKKMTEDDQETVEQDLSGKKKRMRKAGRMKRITQKKKARKDERQSQNEKDNERRKRKALMRARKRSRSKEICDIREEKEVKTRRKLKAESVSPESISETDQ